MSIAPKIPNGIEKYCFVWCGKTAEQGCDCANRVHRQYKIDASPMQFWGDQEDASNAVVNAELNREYYEAL